MVETKVKIKNSGDAADYGFVNGDFVNKEIFDIVVAKLKTEGKEIPIFTYPFIITVDGEAVKIKKGYMEKFMDIEGGK